ncbi:myosin light chain kinase 3-like [Oncorhynchus nerka]|uniref:myosin light chain kinase 3-like n=1 Tax=Oncorhynchus nerka TaxID=8023 RepID=UPI0031B82BD7
MSSKVVNYNSTSRKPSTMDNVTDCNGAGLDHIQNRIESLNSKMDKLINFQEKVLNRLDGMSQDIDSIERDMETLKVDKEEIHIPARARTLPPALAQTQGTGMGGEVREMCQEMSSIMTVLDQRSEKQAEKLDGMEKLVLSIHQVIRFIGETMKSPRVMEMMFMGPAAHKASKSKDLKMAIKRQSSAEKSKSSVTKKTDKPKDHKKKDGKEKSGLKAQKKKKLPDTADTISLRKQVLLLEEVQKLNRENAERSSSSSGHQQQQHLTPEGFLDLEAGSGAASEGSFSPNLLDLILEGPKAPVTEEESLSEEEAAGDGLKVEERKEEEVVKKEKEDHPVNESKEEERKEELLKTTEKPEEDGRLEEKEGEKEKEGDTTLSKGPSEIVDMSVKDIPSLPTSSEAPGDTNSIPVSCEDHFKSASSLSLEAAKQDQVEEGSTGSKRRVMEEDLGVEDHKKSRVEEGEDEGWGVFKADGVDIRVERKKRLGKDQATEVKQSTGETFFIDKSPPPPAPFNHRIVSAKPNQINNFYTINRVEILGGGRFGQVHKCMENSSGLTLASKIIKARSQKEKEMVKNEIMVMNQLDHANLIQLYAAYESRNDIILVLEYVDGGELFDRIIDENYTLMELDTVMFIRQICEGLQHMHNMYILHLDLKPENILCVSRVTNKIKIIDFGLARKYIPREKLRVNFGTPEFLAPEVVNYDFVSFNTDMWSLGVITYMLLSGLCPFLGDNNPETLNNILACQWNFDEEEFTDISEEAKDFISKLLIVNKSWRIGASEALRHPWLSDPVLHHRLHEKKNMCHCSRRSSCVPITES